MGAGWRIAGPRWALGLLFVGAVPAILAALPLLAVADNRLMPGTPVPAGHALRNLLVPLIVLCVAHGLLLARGRTGSAALLGAAALLVLGAGLGLGAADLASGRPPATRVRLASGAWTALLLLALGALAAAGRAGGSWRLAIPVGLAMGLVLLAWGGVLDALSLAIEFRARSATLGAALATHVTLAAGALVLAGVGAFVLAALRPAGGWPDLLASGVQVVPAVALLGGLVALLSSLLAAWPELRALGLSALGPVPAIAGTAAYLLLPLRRGLTAAGRAPDPATLDAAVGLGLSSYRILFGVRLPLGAPALIGALRVATVQAIGLVTLGALVGAGGLGSVLFDGMAQFAPDLILLGALPVIALSLAAEGGLGRLERWVRCRWPR